MGKVKLSLAQEIQH